MKESFSNEHSGAFFRTTHWSVVLAATEPSPDSNLAMENLCRAYWPPLYAFVRRRGYSPDQAQDLTQEFFARLLADQSLQSADPNRGRFRTFLLAALKNYLANEWRDANRQKRGGGKQIISWDEFDSEERSQFEPSESLSPEILFDRRWAQRIVDAALEKLEREAKRDGIETRFAELKAFLQGDGQPGSYAKAAGKLGMSEAAVKSAIYRMRRRYGDILRDQVSETVASPDEVEPEIQHLIAVLGAQ